MNIPAVTFHEARQYFACDADMARAFQVSRASVCEWRKAGRLPPLRAMQFAQWRADEPAPLAAAVSSS